jgi:sterol desaturase/sphingolipid hydroxylase (fatty acid hydroxylase superfamily)
MYAEKLSNHSIQIKRISAIKHIKHDFLYSLQSIAISSILITFLVAACSKDKTQIYSSSSSYPYLYTIISVFIVLFIDDTFLCWSHRLTHHPELFKYTRKAHQYSIDPSPFTSIAFQPIETLLENFVGIILPFILPIHWNIILIWQFISFTKNFIAHLGYEVYPAFWIKLPFLKLKKTSTHNNMHHRCLNSNYALYFT